MVARVHSVPVVATVTILLVDDEPSLRAVVGRLLKQAGYDVLEAGDADHAVEVFGRSRRIDILLTDVTMPGRNGRQLADELTSSNPSLRVIFMSGHYQDPVLEARVASDTVAFIEKPLSKEELVEKVRQVLISGSGTYPVTRPR